MCLYAGIKTCTDVLKGSVNGTRTHSIQYHPAARTNHVLYWCDYESVIDYAPLPAMGRGIGPSPCSAYWSGPASACRAQSVQAGRNTNQERPALARSAYHHT